MAKTDKIEEPTKEVIRSKFRLGSFLKKIWKIFFNILAISGIITVILAGVTRILPMNIKTKIQNAIQTFESPIEEALTDPDACYMDMQNRHEHKFKDSPEYKAICLTNAQAKLARKYSSELYKKAAEVNHAEKEVRQGVNFSEIAILDLPIYDLNDPDGVMKDCQKYNGYWIAEIEIIPGQPNLARTVEWFESIPLEKVVELKVKEFNYNTCNDRVNSYIVYKLTGEKMPYYDRINKKAVEYAEDYHYGK